MRAFFLKRPLPFFLMAGLLMAAGCTSLSQGDGQDALLVHGKALIGIQQDYEIDHLGAASKSDSLLAFGSSADTFYRISPAVGGHEVVLVNRGGAVMTLDAATGHLLWKQKTGHVFSVTPGLNDTHAFLATDSGLIMALDRKAGSTSWEQQLDSAIVATPVLSQQKLLVRTQNDTLYALSANDGQVLWQYHEDVPEMVSRVNAAPVIEGGYVLLALSKGQLVILSLDHGDLVARHQLFHGHGDTLISRMADIGANPLLDHYALYVSSTHAGTMAYDLHAGRVLWRNAAVSSTNNMQMDDRALYISGATGDVVALDRQTGQVLWSQAGLHHLSLSAPAIMQETLVLGDERGRLVWLDRHDGHVLAVASPKAGSILSNPVVVGQAVYVYTLSGALLKYQHVPLAPGS